jgi:hypothetical protein
MRRLERHLFRFPNSAVQRPAGFFVTNVLGGLEHCGGHVTEEQAMLLLQAGLYLGKIPPRPLHGRNRGEDGVDIDKLGNGHVAAM